MKGIYLVAIFYMAILSVVALNELPVADIPTECPKVNPGNKTVFVPHESDCTKFYSCHMGTKGEPLNCPFMDKNGNRLHFNPKLQVCDWPWNAGCQVSSSTSTTTSSSVSTSITTQSTSPPPTTTTSSSPLPTTTTPSSPPPTTTTPSSPPPTTTTPSSPPPTTTTPSSPPPTTTTPSSPPPTTTTPSSPPPTTTTPSSPPPTTTTPSSPPPTTTTPSSPPPTTTTPSSPPPTTITPSSLPPTTTTPSSPPPTTTTPSAPPPTTTTPSAPPPTTTTPSSPTLTTPLPSFPTTPSLNSCEFDNRIHMLPHKTMCDHYYSCFNGIVNPIPQKCERNLLFNPKLRVCDYPENVNCNNIPPSIIPSTIRSLITTSMHSNPSSTSSSSFSISTRSIPWDPTAWVCEPNGKLYKVPHEIMCNYFYWCVNGIKSTEPIKCENDLLFNPIVGECDYLENVDCSGRSTPSQGTTITTVTLPKTTTKKSTITTTTESSTTTKKSTITTTTESPTTTKKSTITTTTESPTTTKKSTITTTETPTTTKKSTITTTTESPTTTKKSTITTTTESPTTTKKSTITTTTESPTTTKKSTITTTETPTTTKDPNKPRENCPPKGSTEKARIAHPCLCNHYYECVDGEKILETCPIGKHFDYVREVCDWAAKVKCIRPIPTFDILIGDYNTHYNTCAPEGRAFQHDTDCSAYYFCSNGEKILRHCEEGLHFNMTIQTCDYPQKICDLNRTLPTISLDTCPPPGSIGNVFLPHECECTWYYECVGGKQVLRACPSGLHFDGVRQICNNPTEVNCITYTTSTTPRTVSTTTTKAIDKSRITCPPKGSSESARHPHPCLCNQYYECVEGDKILRTCPIGMYFDDVKKVCDWATKEKCIQPLSSHAILDEHDTKCSPDGRAFQHEFSCTKYYLCLEGKKILKSCVEGLHFNVTVQMCDYPLKKCDLMPRLTITLDVCPSAGSEKVLFPHECQCTQYYECIDGKQILRDCPDGLYYDHVRQVCNEPTEAKCANLAPTIPTKPSTPNSDSGCYDEDSEIPYEYDCRFYYKCSNGKKILKTCPRNLYFNPKLRVCDFPENVACDARSTNVPTVPNKCSTTTGTTKIPHETDCNLYYVCENGISTLKKCHSPELVFNPILKVCDFPENYICNVTRAKNDFETTAKMITQNLDPSTCIGTCPEEDPEYAVFLPNDDCKKFCMCSGGVAWVQSCPEPLYFDSVQKVCKRKKDAVCAKRSFSRDDAYTVDKVNDNDNSLKSPTDENNERDTYDNLDPSTCIGTCPEEDPEYAVFLPNDDCKKFCMCSGGVAWVQSCPEPLYFDSVQKVCKRKKDAVCAKRSFSQDDAFTIHNTGNNDDNSSELLSKNDTEKRETYNLGSKHLYNLDPSTCIGTCPEEDPEYAVLLPNDDCKKFCLCSNGLAYVLACPEPLYFDSVDKVCKRKKAAVCAVRSLDLSLMTDRLFDEDFERSLSEESYDEREIYNNPWYKRRFYDDDPCIGICPEENPKYAVILPHEDCRKFCICNNGLAYVQLCPEPLYFHSMAKVCRQRRHVVCATTENDEDDSIEYLSDENNERRRYNYLRPKPPFHSFSSSTCIGICSEDDSTYTILYPHEDCRKFCLCNNGVTWVQSCPEPLYFDSIHKICKRKRDAICGFSRNHAVTIDKEVNDKERIEFQSEESDEREVYNSWYKLHSYHHDTSTCIDTCDEDSNYAILVPNLDCRKFCICNNGLAWVHSCPDLLYFDSIDKICKWKRNAICAINLFNKNRPFMFNKVGNEKDLMTPSSEEKNHERRKRDDIWPKLHFLAHQSFNDLDPSTCIGTCPEEDPEYAVLLPNDDCKKFCMCSSGVAWVQSCPEPLYFDSVQKVCKRKKDAVCGVRSFSQDNIFTVAKMIDNDNSLKSSTDENNERGTYDNLDPSTCIGTCPEEDPEYAVFLPNDDCKKFCMCSGGVAWVQSCPEPLYFDSVQKVCKRKKDAVCAKRSFSRDDAHTIDKVNDNDNSLKSPIDENNERGTYDNLDPSTCIGTCPEEDPEYAVFLPNDDCKKFCMCSGGVAWVQSCPEPLYFDSVQKVCKRKKDAVCAKRSFSRDDAHTIDKVNDNDNLLKSPTNENNERGTYDNLDPSTCIGTCPEEDPEYAVLLPNDDCKKFCMCSNGIAWVQSCPEPLYFDSVQKVCKRKKDAVCAVRL